MNPDQQASIEERFTSLMAAYDEALAAVGALAAGGASQEGVALSPELQARLERNVVCARLLRQLRTGQPPEASHVVSSTPDPEPRAEGDTPAGSDTAPLPPPLAFERLGRFEIRRELGRGGFGIVYLAHDPDLRRDVALKILRADALVHPEARARFQREARAAAGLDHPNLVAVYETGEVGAVCFITMAYCPGSTLADWLKHRVEPVPFPAAAELIVTLAGAVHYAHQHGVLHRDLKPANILILQTDEGERMKDEKKTENSSDSSFILHPSSFKIADFGLAKNIASTGHQPGASGLTQSGAILGTPSYMAPEQAEGKNQSIGPATDVYALGAILYELLTGRPPFRGETALDTLLQVQTAEPVPLRRLRPRVPRDLETICLKCLRKEQSKRYDCAASLADDVQRFLDRKPIRARPAGVWERAVKWAKRRPSVAALIAVIVLTLLGGFAGVLVHSHQLGQALQDATTHRLEAETQRQRAAGNFQKACDAVEQMLTVVADRQLASLPHMETVRQDLLKKALAFYEELLQDKGDDPALRQETGRAHGRVGHIFALLGKHQEADQAYAAALGFFHQLAADFPDNPAYGLDLAHAHNEWGQLLEDSGRRPEAANHFQEALDILTRLAAAHPANPVFRLHQAQAHFHLGSLYRKTGRLKDAEEAQQKALAIREALVDGAPDDLNYRHDLASSYHSLAILYANSDRPKQAEEGFRKTLAIRQDLSRAQPANVQYQSELALAHDNLGMVLEIADRLPQAEQAYFDAIAIRKALVRDYPGILGYHGALASSYSNLGNLYKAMNRRDQAAKATQDALAIYENLARDHPTIVKYTTGKGGQLCNLGQLFAHTGDPEASLPWYAKAIATLQPVVAQQPNDAEGRDFLINSYWGRAFALTKLSRHAESLPDWDRVVELSKPAERAVFRMERAKALARAKELDKAIAEAAALTASPQTAPRLLFQAARVFALAAAAVTEGKQAAEYAVRAVELLRRYPTKDAKFLKGLHQEKDFDAIRSGESFKQLVRELEEKVPPDSK